MEKFAQYLKTNKASDIAATLGVTKAYISQLAHGRTTPSLKRAIQIEDATGGQVPARSWVE